MTVVAIKLDAGRCSTVLAALTLYAAEGFGGSPAIHEVATDYGTIREPLDNAGLSRLWVSIRREAALVGPGVSSVVVNRPEFQMIRAALGLYGKRGMDRPSNWTAGIREVVSACPGTAMPLGRQGIADFVYEMGEWASGSPDGSAGHLHVDPCFRGWQVSSLHLVADRGVSPGATSIPSGVKLGACSVGLDPELDCGCSPGLALAHPYFQGK